MKRKAFGAIDLLLGLLITAFVFLIGMNALKGVSSLKLNGSNTDTKSIQQEVDRQVSEIENMRQQTIDHNRQVQSENY